MKWYSTQGFWWLVVSGKFNGWHENHQSVKLNSTPIFPTISMIFYVLLSTLLYAIAAESKVYN